ncbi:MAG: hypothetical protein ABGW95_02495 [Candidatus Poseidoniia archaeon]
MAQLLDDEDPQAPPDADLAPKTKTPTEERFDASEGDDGSLDVDDEAPVSEGADPPEIDEL